jgi:hypothetical protein
MPARIRSLDLEPRAGTRGGSRSFRYCVLGVIMTRPNLLQVLLLMLRVVLPSALVVLGLAPLVAQQQSAPKPASTFRVGQALVEVQGDGARVSRDAGRTFAALPATDNRLHLRSGVFDPLLQPQRFDGLLAAPPSGRLFCVQSRTAILPEYRAALEALGFEVVAYLPQNAYVVRGERPASLLLVQESWVRSVGAIAVGQKLDPALFSLLAAVGPETPALFHVVLAKKSDRDRLVREIADVGGVVTDRQEGSIFLIASLLPTQLARVVALDSVLWIDAADSIEFDMDNARIQGGGNYVESMAGYTGVGVRAEISEGLDQTHPDWTNPVLVRFDSTDQHGHCTAMIVGGNGSGNAAARGMIPDAQVIESSVNAWGGLSRFAVIQGSCDPAGPWRAMQQTASWGSTLTLDYTSTSAALDDALFTFDFVLTQSQSNAGGSAIPQNSRPQAWAKNVISVGGVRHLNNSNPADDVWSTASIGPASDGRIKPEICAYYESVLCGDLPGAAGYSATDYYSSFSGTSSATPIVSGHVGILQQMFTDGLFHNPLPQPAIAAFRFENKAHMTTTKSLLVNTAASYAFSGTTANLTRTHQGWGFPDLRRVYDNRDNLLVIDEYTALQQSQSRSYFVWIRPGTSTFRATMTYADPAAVPLAAIHRVNSVDLEVAQLVGGTTWWGNNGLDIGNVSTPFGVANDLDTTENVWLSNPTPGIYEITVSAPTIVQDGRVETPELDIDYALVVHPVGGGFHRQTAMNLDLVAATPGQLDVQLTGVPSGWTEGYTFFSLATSGPKGFGNLFGVERDFLVDAILVEPAIPGGILHFTNNGVGSYPYATFSFPPGLILQLSGLTIDAMVMLMTPSGVVVEQSNVDRVTLQ